MIRSAGESKSATTAGAAAVEIAFDMGPGRQYRLTARGAALWFAVITPSGGVSPPGAPTVASVAGDGCHYLANGSTFDVAAIGRYQNNSGAANPAYRSRISIIRDGGTDATGVLSDVMTVQPG